MTFLKTSSYPLKAAGRAYFSGVRVGGRGGGGRTASVSSQRGMPGRKGRDAPASLFAVLRDGGEGRGFVLHPRRANCAQVQPPLRTGTSAQDSLRTHVAQKKRRKASSTSSQVRRNLVPPSPLHVRVSAGASAPCAAAVRLGLCCGMQGQPLMRAFSFVFFLPFFLSLFFFFLVAEAAAGRDT